MTCRKFMPQYPWPPLTDEMLAAMEVNTANTGHHVKCDGRPRLLLASKGWRDWYAIGDELH